MKNDKNPEEDNITGEAIKQGKEIFYSGKSPNCYYCTRSETVKTENYRPLSLSPILSKIFSKLIQKRRKNSLEEYQEEEQAGFHKGRSAINHLHAICQLFEKSTEYKSNLYICFLDSHKAFDSRAQRHVEGTKTRRKK